VREEEIIDIISILDSNKATGPDKISNKMIISIKNEIAKPLCLLFNKSLRLKKYPRSWKIAHVIPLFKNGDKSLPSNYRPVSLLYCVSKIFANFNRSPPIQTRSNVLLTSAKVIIVKHLLSSAVKIV
jgi:hypothetical protein